MAVSAAAELGPVADGESVPKLVVYYTEGKLLARGETNVGVNPGYHVGALEIGTYGGN